MPVTHNQIVIVTGMSGAGRSTALHTLEDLGFFCVDNLPLEFISRVVEHVLSEGAFNRIALGVDVRTGRGFADVTRVLETMKTAGYNIEVIFLDCANALLVRRYSESRRPHPLTRDGNILDAVEEERERLAPIRTCADYTIDTTRLNVHDLRQLLIEHLSRDQKRPSMVLRLMSFGYKYGVPLDADLVFDVRYLPNPFFVSDLKELVGTNDKVATFVVGSTEGQELLGDLRALLEKLLPKYEKEGKTYLTVAFGCTGGKHRSVAIAEDMAKHFSPLQPTRVVHRDIERRHA